MFSSDATSKNSSIKQISQKVSNKN